MSESVEHPYVGFNGRRPEIVKEAMKALGY